jgi:DNA-binding MurR/RpiR family transcriptional regulator
MNNVIDIITRLQMTVENGSKSDRRLAAIVLADLDFASKASISEIAAKIDVSEPTVTRFCRGLGCEGVRDFKFWLAQAIAVGGQYLTAEPVNRDQREQRVASVVSEAAIAAIERVTASVDMRAVLDVAETLEGSGQILCIGSGGTSSMLATEMQNRLFRLGLSAISQVDGQLQRMFAAVSTPQTTILAFSISGYAQSIVDATKVARQYGAKTIAVTAPGSNLAKTAQLVIPFQPVEDGNLYKPTSSRFALLAIVDMIATATAETRGTKVLESLRRIKQSINTLKVDDPRLPLGD